MVAMMLDIKVVHPVLKWAIRGKDFVVLLDVLERIIVVLKLDEFHL